MRLAVATLFALLSLHPAQAQTKIYVLLGGAEGARCTAVDCEPGFVMEIDVDGRQIVSKTQIAYAREDAIGPRITAEGRYLAWIGVESLGTAAYLTIFDTVSGTTVHSARQLVRFLYAHPSRTALYTVNPLNVIQMRPTGQDAWSAGCNLPWLSGINADGSRLFAYCLDPSSPQKGTTIVLDTTAGTQLATVPGLDFMQTPNAAGTEIYSAEYVYLPTPGTTHTVISRHDVATRMVLAQRTEGPPSAYVADLIVDPRSGRLFSWSSSNLSIYNGTTLAFEGRLPIANIVDVDVDTESGRVFVLNTTSGDGIHQGARLTVLDGNQLVTIAEADLPAKSRAVGMEIMPKPPRPSNLSASGGTGTALLRWTAGSGPGAVLEYIVEAGLSPSATDATIHVPASATTLTVTNVPPGTYYVRIRAANAVTRSAATNEVRIDVR